MKEYTQKLKEIRKEINNKNQEIKELEKNSQEIWERITKEINNNKNTYKKQNGLSGLKNAELIISENNNPSHNSIIITFENKPTAKGLSIIEETIGLTFDKTITDNKYLFQL